MEQQYYNDSKIKPDELVQENELNTLKIKKKLGILSTERDRVVLIAFIQKAIDEKRILMMDRLFSFVDEYLKGANS